MTTINKDETSQFAYAALKNRLRLLLKDLEVRYEINNYTDDTTTLKEMNKIEINNGDCSKQSKKIEQLHNDLRILIKDLERIKKTTYEGSHDSCLYDELGEKIFMKQSILNELERRHAFLCESLKNMHHELKQKKRNLPFLKHNWNSAYCYKMGDGKSNSYMEIKKRLDTLKQKCEKMRTQQRHLLNCCSNNPIHMETYADNYSNQYKNLLQTYADRISTMGDLCVEYKRMIKEKQAFIDEDNSPTYLKQCDNSTQNVDDISINISLVSLQLKQMNMKLQKEVDNIEFAMEKLQFMQQYQK